ncbi:MAG: hypothetical protein MI863_05670 [Desulfobacterales bacterium]|nr:hypothetical protein [Desulfobacterales bacterium]
MSNTAIIRGIGWVLKESMGFPGHIRPAGQGLSLPELSGKQVLGQPYKAFGRMDYFSKLGFSAIAFAMSHAGILPLPVKDKNPVQKKEIPLIAESATGCIETDLLYQSAMSRKPVMPSPALFAYTLPSCFLGEAAIYFGLTGEAYMMEPPDSNGLTALSTAMDNLAIYPRVVCGVCNSDGYACPGALFLVLDRLDADTGKHRSHPFPLTITRHSTAGPFHCNGTPVTALQGLAFDPATS